MKDKRKFYHVAEKSGIENKKAETQTLDFIGSFDALSFLKGNSSLKS